MSGMITITAGDNDRSSKRNSKIQMQTEDLAYDLSINESQMTQEPISEAFIGISDKIALS